MPEQPFALAGQLDTQAVATAWRRSRRALASGKLPASIDLGQITQSDSATLALLLEWQAHARARGKQLEFTNPPESLLVLAGLSNVQTLLGWEPADTGPDSVQAATNGTKS